MARVTVDDVKSIMEDYVESNRLAPFLSVANRIVNTELVGKYSDEELLSEIERWLAAHLAASTIYRQTQSEVTLGSEVSYNAISGTGLNSTSYGQQVALLDYLSVLINTQAKKIIFNSI